MVKFEKAIAGSEWSEVAMKAPPRNCGLGNPQTEGIRVRSRKEEIFWAHSHLPKAAGRDEAVKSEPVRREPRRRGRLIRNTAIAATLLNGLLVTSVILLIAMLVPGSLPTANGGDESTGDALATPSAYQEPVEQGLAVTVNREFEPPSVAEQAGIRVPAQRNQPAATEATSSWSAAMIEEVLTAIEESSESGMSARTASAASAAHPVAASSSILQKRPPTDQSASPDSAFPDRLVETPALAAEGHRPSAQAPDTSSESADTGVRLIKFEEKAVATADSTEPDRPRTAATEPSDEVGLPAGVDPQPADGPPDGLALTETGDVSDGQLSVGELAPDAPDIASTGSEVTPEVTRSAPVRVAVNLRAEPGLDAPIITVLAKGTEVGVIGCEGWCEVVFADKRGWIYGSLLRDGVADSNSGAMTSSGIADADGSGGAGTASVNVGNPPSSSKDTPANSISEAAQSAGEPTVASNLPVAAGTPLISADGAQIGLIRDVTSDASGQIFLVVDLKEELRTALPSIRIRTEHVLAADRHARLKFTRAQLVDSLPTTIGRRRAQSGLTPRAP